MVDSYGRLFQYPVIEETGDQEKNRLFVVGAPENYFKLLEPLPTGLEFVSRISASIDIVHIFTGSKTELQKVLLRFRLKAKPAVAVWASWPKKSSKLRTDLTEDVVRDIGLPLGFVDTKVCAIDDVWSGLKLVVRKSLR